MTVIIYSCVFSKESKTFQPIYEKMAKEFMKYNPPIYCATIDADVSGDLVDKFNVKGFPAVYAVM